MLWTIDSGDWEKPNAEKISVSVVNNIQDGDIIVFHDDNAETVKALDKIIAELKTRGFQFVTVSYLLEDWLWKEQSTSNEQLQGTSGQKLNIEFHRRYFFNPIPEEKECYFYYALKIAVLLRSKPTAKECWSYGSFPHETQQGLYRNEQLPSTQQSLS